MFQRDPGPWSQLLIEWLATLGVIIVFGLVMLYSASYTTGYLRMGSSLHYIGVQLIFAGIGLGIMYVISFVDHRFLRWAAKPAYWVVLALLAAWLAVSLWRILHHRGCCGCCGDCTHCRTSCRKDR